MNHGRKFTTRPLGLQVKFFITYCMIVSLLCGSIGIVYYKTTGSALSRMVTKDALTILQKNNQIIDQQLESIENYANSFVADQSFDDYMVQYQAAQSVYDYYRLDHPITKLLHNYFSSSPSIFSAHVITRKTSYGELFGSNIIPVQNFSKSRIYQAAIAGEGKTVWIPTYDFFTEYGQSSILSEKDPYRSVFSAAKLIWQTSDDYMVLVIHFLDDVYSELFETQFTEYEGSYFVIAPDGSIVCQSGGSAFDPSGAPPLATSTFSQDSGYVIQKLEGEEFIVCYDVSDITGWISAWVIRQDVILNQFANELAQNLAVILIILIILPLILILYINAKMIRPLNALQEGIKETGKGNFRTEVKVEGFQEIRSLIQNFNESNRKIDSLIKENYESQLLKKEAELAAYDLQLNPHFILNTLNLINLELITSGNDRMCEMISSLSRVIEYTLRTRSLQVPFALDLANTQNYLHIMQKRYKDKFTVAYEIEEELLTTEVPKLFLQPLVENSIKHGFASISWQGKITIRAKRMNHLRIFEVEDNGCGFSPDTLRELQAKDSPHIGINNIRCRVQYLYGDGYGLEISPVSPHGVCIRISLPKALSVQL